METMSMGSSSLYTYPSLRVTGFICTRFKVATFSLLFLPSRSLLSSPCNVGQQSDSLWPTQGAGALASSFLSCSLEIPRSVKRPGCGSFRMTGPAEWQPVPPHVWRTLFRALCPAPRCQVTQLPQGPQARPADPPTWAQPKLPTQKKFIPASTHRLPSVWELSPYPFYYLFCLKHSACLRWSLLLRHGFWTLYVPGHSSLDTFKVAKFLFKLCGSRNWKQCFKDDLLLLTLRVFLLFPTASSPLTSPRALASSSLSCPCLSPSPKRQQFSHPSGTKSNLHHSFASLSPAPDPFSQCFAGPAFSSVRCAGWLLWLGHEFLESSYFLYLNTSPGTWHMSGAQ